MHLYNNYKKLTIGVLLLLIILGLFPNTIVNVAGIHEKKISEYNCFKDDNIISDFLFDLKLISQKRVAHFPSISCCIIKGDEEVWNKSYGFSKIYLLHRANSQTTYRIGSVSKSFTATAVLILHDKGLLSINDDINDYLPFDIRNPNHPDTVITIKMLLAHQSGIYDYCLRDPEGFKSDFKNVIPFPKDAGEWLQSVLIPGGELYKPEYWKKWEPGTNVSYSSIAYTILGYIIKELTGSFEDYVTNNIFKPLQMNNTGYFFSDINMSNMATPYWFYGYKYGIYLPFPNYRFNCFNSVGGVISCIEDMSHYLIMHMNKGVYNGVRILNESTTEMMHTVQLNISDMDDFGLRYGLGWMFVDHFGEAMEGHVGGIPGFNCAMIMNKTSNIGFIFLANQNNWNYDERFMNAFTSIGKLLLEKAEEFE